MTTQIAITGVPTRSSAVIESELSSSFSKSSRNSSLVIRATRIRPQTIVARTASTSPTIPMMKPAWASPWFFWVSPRATLALPLRESTIPATEQPIDTSDEMPPERNSNPADTSDSTKPVTAGPLSGWAGAG